MQIMPTKLRSRYFDYGRIHISGKIMKRLGKYNEVPGLMETLTYDPKKISTQEAWEPENLRRIRVSLSRKKEKPPGFRAVRFNYTLALKK